MKFFSKYMILPGKKDLFSQIDAAADRLIKKLYKLNLKNLGISEYNHRYLGDYIQNRKSTLQNYSYLLFWSLDGIQKPLEKITLADYGGGCGLMSLLARELGIGTVIYNDIYDISCRDARAIAIALNLLATEYHCGDVDQLVDFLKRQGYSPDVVVSFDVIEHIYNTEAWLHTLSSIQRKDQKLVFASGANTHNPMTRRRLKKAHYAAEYIGKKDAWGLKERDTLRAHLDVRKEIIRSYDPSLTEPTVDMLARQTRGLVKKDIEICVWEFRTTGKHSYIPDHNTNTCDPYTGNWSERLMNTGYLKSILEKEGYSVRVRCGYYTLCQQVIKNMLKYSLNILITLLGRKGLWLAQYYIIIASV